MKKLALFIVALVSVTNLSANISTPQPLDYYQSISCSEMTNLSSHDEFIRHAAREILTDLGKDVCLKVQTQESLHLGEIAERDQISAVQFGKLIDSIHTLYTYQD